MRTSLIAAVGAALLLLGAGCPAPTPQPNTNTAAEIEESGLQDQTVIRMTDAGFDPATITIPKGTPVMFFNESSAPRWPASAPHPTHTNYPEFDPKAGIEPGQSWTFTFDKPGAWAFHDHLQATKFGKITVTE